MKVTNWGNPNITTIRKPNCKQVYECKRRLHIYTQLQISALKP